MLKTKEQARHAVRGAQMIDEYPGTMDDEARACDVELYVTGAGLSRGGRLWRATIYGMADTRKPNLGLRYVWHRWE